MHLRHIDLVLQVILIYLKMDVKTIGGACTVRVVGKLII